MGQLTRNQLGRLRGETSALLYRAQESAPEPARNMIEHSIQVFEQITPAMAGYPGNSAFNFLNYLPGVANNAAWGPFNGLVRSVAELSFGLPWMQTATYMNIAAMQMYLAQSAYCQLVGPLGAIPSRDVKVGFWGMGPDLHYPAHSHAAAETYVVLGGKLKWQVDETHREVGPGDVVYHAPWQIHAMESLDEPVLACFIWTSDLDSLPRANVT